MSHSRQTSLYGEMDQFNFAIFMASNLLLLVPQNVADADEFDIFLHSSFVCSFALSNHAMPYFDLLACKYCLSTFISFAALEQLWADEIWLIVWLMKIRAKCCLWQCVSELKWWIGGKVCAPIWCLLPECARFLTSLDCVTHPTLIAPHTIQLLLSYSR